MKLLWLAMASLLLSSPLLSPLATSNSGPTLSSVDLGTVPRGVSFDSSLGAVYVVLFLNGTTLSLNAQTFATIAKIPTPSPYAIAVDQATKRVYVSQGEGASVSVIDGSRNSVVATVQGAGTPYALSVDEPQNLLFAADTSEGSLWAVNGSTNSVVARILMGDTSALAVDPGVGEAFIGNLSSSSQSGTIDVINTTSLTVIKTIPVDVPPGHFSVDPVSHLLFVTSADPSGTAPNFLAIDDKTFKTVYSLHLGESPNVMAVAASPDVYVSDTGTNRLYEVDGATGRVLFNSTGGPGGISYAGITSMAFDDGTGRLYITENDVTSLIVLTVGSSTASSTGSSTTSSTGSSTGSSSTSLSASVYLLLAVPAVASALAGLLAILYVRRRARSAVGSPQNSSEGIKGPAEGSGT